NGPQANELVSRSRLTSHASRFTLHASRFTFHAPPPSPGRLSRDYRSGSFGHHSRLCCWQPPHPLQPRARAKTPGTPANPPPPDRHPSDQFTTRHCCRHQLCSQTQPQLTHHQSPITHYSITPSLHASHAAHHRNSHLADGLRLWT